LAGALTAAKLNFPIAHIEAGMRSYDKTMPEEINRLLTDHISDALFVTSHLDTQNLLKEGIDQREIFLVGNIMTDVLMEQKKKVSNSILKKLGLQKKKYALLTLHRAGNVDNKENLKEILSAIKKISERIPVIFPVHPRAKKMINFFGFKRLIKEIPNLFLIKPLSYFQMTSLVKNSKLVLTDSGGLQHETTVLGVPCLTLRNVTEWLITVKQGTNKVVGTSKENIIKEAFKILGSKNRSFLEKRKIPQYWDGKTAKRIIQILLKYYVRH